MTDLFHPSCSSLQCRFASASCLAVLRVMFRLRRLLWSLCDCYKARFSHVLGILDMQLKPRKWPERMLSVISCLVRRHLGEDEGRRLKGGCNNWMFLLLHLSAVAFCKAQQAPKSAYSNNGPQYLATKEPSPPANDVCSNELAIRDENIT